MGSSLSLSLSKRRAVELKLSFYVLSNGRKEPLPAENAEWGKKRSADTNIGTDPYRHLPQTVARQIHYLCLLEKSLARSKERCTCRHPLLDVGTQRPRIRALPVRCPPFWAADAKTSRRTQELRHLPYVMRFRWALLNSGNYWRCCTTRY